MNTQQTEDTVMIAQGTLENVLKRIGSAKSKLLCVGTDPLTLSGVVVAKGKIVSSKILDVTVTPAMNETLEDDKINTVTIKYVDAHDKSIRKTTFDILNQEALYELLRNSLKISEFAKKARIYDEKITYFDEKIKNIEEKLDKILEQLDTIANNDVTESSIENHPKLDFNTLSIYGIDNGKEYDLKVDILDVEKYKYFKHQVLLKFETIEQHFHQLLHHRHDLHNGENNPNDLLINEKEELN